MGSFADEPLSNSQLSLRLSHAGLSLLTSDTQENFQCNVCLVQVTVISLFYLKFGVLEGSCVVEATEVETPRFYRLPL